MRIAGEQRAKVRKYVACGLALVAGAFGVQGLYDTALRYSDFKIAYGRDVWGIHYSELTYYSWFMIYGVFAVAGLTAGLSATDLTVRLKARLSIFLEKERLFVAACAAFVFFSSLLFRMFVLLDSPVSDDESTYVFIAKTLLNGRFVNPLPGDNAFFGNQFVVMNDSGWFGKYPIGHPLLLAAAVRAHALHLVGPVLTCLSLIFTFLIGKRLFGAKSAGVGLCLLSISPHFICTGATHASQITSTLAMLVGLWATLLLQEWKRAVWAVVAGIAWGFGILARPLPGALFLAAAALVFVCQRQALTWSRHLKTSARFLVVAALPVAAVVAVMALVNHQQTGSSLTTGYHVLHGKSLGVAVEIKGQIAMSVAAAVLRQNFWLFGWPCSWLFVFFVRGRKSLALFFGLIAAEYLYRVAAPKTVVATTGPVYVTEIVPLLALAAGSGIVQLKRWLEERGAQWAQKVVLSVVVASTVVALTCFWPFQIVGIRRSAQIWRTPYRILEKAGVGRALVFAKTMVYPQAAVSWAYYTPSPSPSWDDDVIFVRPPGYEPEHVVQMTEFWRRRFPDRAAWIMQFAEDGRLQMEPLEKFKPQPKPKTD